MKPIACSSECNARNSVVACSRAASTWRSSGRVLCGAVAPAEYRRQVFVTLEITFFVIGYPGQKARKVLDFKGCICTAVGVATYGSRAGGPPSRPAWAASSTRPKITFSYYLVLYHFYFFGPFSRVILVLHFCGWGSAAVGNYLGGAALFPSYPSFHLAILLSFSGFYRPQGSAHSGRGGLTSGGCAKLSPPPH